MSNKIFFQNNIPFFVNSEIYLFKDDNQFSISNSEDFFGLNKTNSNNIELNNTYKPFLLLKKIIRPNDLLILIYENLKESKKSYQVYPIKIIGTDNLLKTLMKEFDYLSDEGFLIINKQKGWAYFFGENFYKSTNETNSFESYSLFIIKKGCEFNFLKKVKEIGKFKIKLFNYKDIINQGILNIKEIEFQ